MNGSKDALLQQARDFLETVHDGEYGYSECTRDELIEKIDVALADGVAPAAPTPAGRDVLPLLRAMVANYKDGHRWDDLDAWACAAAADEIERARAVGAPAKAGTQPQPPGNEAMDRLYEAVLREFADRRNVHPSEVEVDPRKHPSFYRALMRSSWLDGWIAGSDADGVLGTSNDQQQEPNHG